MNDWAKAEGTPFPLGATWIEQEESYNFALYSEHATGVTLLLYSDRDAALPCYRYPLNYLKNKTAHVWHRRIPLAEIPDARYYAYYAEGPSAPDLGHRFDPQKILLDPYATAVWFPPEFSREAASRPVLFLANGTPMFRAGDEFMNTQAENNNPCNQDNETSWLNWHLLEKNRDIFLFFKKMIAFRKAHPSLCRSRFWREEVRWYGAGNEVDYGEDSHSVAFCLHGSSQNDDDLYVMINAGSQDLNFAIQEGGPGEWQQVVDRACQARRTFPRRAESRFCDHPLT